MINLYHAYRPIGKVIYYVKGKRFENTSSTQKDGKDKALAYCYDNDIDVFDMIKFDSALECDRYEYLKDLEDTKKISNLEVHKEIELIPEFVNSNGDIIPKQTYKADFIYTENGRRIVEDTKGMSLLQDSRFELAKAIFDYKFNPKCYIRIVVRRDGKWFEWKIGDKKKPQTAKQKRIQERHELLNKIKEKEKEEKKIARTKELYLKYKSLEKRTKQEELRYNKYKDYLIEKGVLL